MREWPARLETWSVTFESGNNVLKTVGVQAPAARRMCVQGISLSALVEVLRMRILESSSRMSVLFCERKVSVLSRSECSDSFKKAFGGTVKGKGNELDRNSFSGMM